MIVQKPWFKAKEYGWGWQPSTWQGWLVMVVWMFVDAGSILLLYTMYGLEDKTVIYMVIVSFLLTFVLIGVCLLTGEKPHWQWGVKKQSTPPTDAV